MRIILALVLRLAMMFFALTFLIGLGAWLIDSQVSLRITIGQSLFLLFVSFLFNSLNDEATP